MDVVTTPAEMRRWARRHRLDGRRLALVPTMGALHAGHLHLVEVATRLADVVVVSIFVNPLQFDRRDDFERYPRPDDDLDRCRRAGVDAVYSPTPDAMYPDGFDTHVEPGTVAQPMEGASRPGHFRGVATVVTKLFNAVTPDVAVFGQKDFQQLAVIRRMTGDLDMGIEIHGVPTVREPDGLAMSSRNRRLEPDDRAAAVCLPRALDDVRAGFANGERDAGTLAAAATATIRAEPRARIDYLTICDAATLQPVGHIADRPVVVAVAAWFGAVRLIDNLLLEPAVTRDATDGTLRS